MKISRYRVRLPDHDFNVGSRHLLVPSVVGICSINANGKVGHTGETYIGRLVLKILREILDVLY